MKSTTDVLPPFAGIKVGLEGAKTLKENLSNIF
jgi:hypothetical protein